MTVVASNYARKENDLYQTEPWATEALLRRFPVRGFFVWEPAAGNHLMADVLRENGATVATSDIKNYDRPHDFLRDFTEPHGDDCKADAIITNPPYGKGNHLATKFVRLALERCPGFVAMLLTAKWDSGKTRLDLTERCPRFLGKVVLVDRISWEGNDEGGTEDHAWFAWGSHRGTPAPLLFYEGKEAPCASS